MAMSCSAFAVRARVNVHIMDADSGEPLTDWEVWATYVGIPSSRFPRAADKTYTRVTDEGGNCRFSGDSTTGRIALEARHKGYYGELVRIEFTNYVESLDKFVPDSQCVTMKVWKVGNRIPLLVKQLSTHSSIDLFNQYGETLKFDMLLGDYLPPAGTGLVSDVEFTRKADEKMDGDVRVWYRGEMKMSFPGDGNGLVEVPANPGSMLKIRSGCDAEFNKEHVYWVKEDLIDPEYLHFKLESNYDVDNHYCFRIRTAKDDSGSVTNAYYGKIYRGIKANHSINPERKHEARFMHVGSPYFTYYLNPTPMDKNLEYDGTHNLLPGKSWTVADN